MDVRWKLGFFLISVSVSFINGIPRQDKTEHIYDYHGRIATGITQQIKQFSGFDIKAKISLRKEGKYTHLKISDPVIGSLNRKVKENLLDEFQYDYSKPSPEDNVLIHNLQKPIRASFEEGIVKSFDASLDEPQWSINIKKGILSLFQLKWDKAEEGTFTIDEESINGLCKTNYDVRRGSDAKTFMVSKFQSLDQCIRGQSMFYANLWGNKCQSQDNEDLLKRTSQANYVITQGYFDFVIQNVNSEGLIFFLPFGAEGEHFVSAVNQSLVLRSSAENNMRFSFTERYRTHDTLQYNFNAIRKDGYYNRLVDVNFENAFEKANDIFEELLKDHASKGEINPSEYYFTEKVTRLLHYLSTFNEEDLKKLTIKLIHREHFSELLTLVLPMVGTSNSNRFIVSLLDPQICGSSADKCQYLNVPRMLTVLPFFMKEPTKAFIQDFIDTELISSDVNTFSRKQHFLVIYGNILYRACYSPLSEYEQQNDKFLSNEECSKYIQALLRNFREEESLLRRHDFLAALINTRSPEVLDDILKEINNRDGVISRRLPFNGLLNFRGPEQKIKIRQYLENFVKDSSEDYVLRTLAYEVLIKMAPDEVYLTQLLKKIFAETNGQLLTYLYDLISNIADSTDFCTHNKKIVNHLKLLLKYIARPEYSNILYSGKKAFQFQNAKYKIGRRLQLGWIGSNSTAFPTELYFEESFNVFGHNYNIMKIGMSQSDFWHMDVFPSAIFGPFNLLDVPVYERRIQKKIVNPAKIIAERKTTDTLDMQHIGAYCIILDQYIGFTDVFYQAFSPYVFFMNTEASYDFPNDMGFPVTLNFNALFTNDFNVDVKRPEENEMNRNTREKKSKLIRNYEAKISEDFFAHTQLAVVKPSAKAYGFAIATMGSTRLPFSGNITFPTNFEAKQLKFSCKIPTEPFLFSKMSSKPFTFIYNLAGIFPDETKDSVVEVGYIPRKTLKTYRFGHDYFGVGINIDISRTNKNFLSTMKDFSNSGNQDEGLFSANGIFAGIMGLDDYLYFNPSCKPLELNLMIEPNSLYPTEEFQFEINLQKLRNVAVSAGDKLLDLAETPDNLFYDLNATLTAAGPKYRSWSCRYRLGTLAPRGEPFNSFILFERSSIPNYDESPLKISYQRKSSSPKLSKSHQDVLPDFHENHIITLKYGQTREKEIVIQSKIQKSDEQKAHLRSKEDKQLFRQCRQQLVLKNLNSDCWKKASDILTLRKATVDIDFQKDQSFLDKLSTPLSFLKHLYSDNLVINSEVSTNPANHLYITANFSEEYPLLDVSISTPKENLDFHSIMLTSVTSNFQPYNIAEGLLQSYARTLLNINPYVSCKVANLISTFDDVKFEAELSKCFHVLAMDCSYGDSFAVLGRSTNNPTYTKAVKIFLRNYTIELVPNETKDPKKGGTMNLWVNGEKKDDPKYLRYFEADPDDRNDRLFDIYFYMGHYMVELYRESVHVDLAAAYIDIQVSHMYRGRMCGACGDLNLDRANEFVGPDYCIYKDPKAFLLSYVVGDGSCSVPNVKCDN